MPEDIADSGNLTPWNVWIARLDVVGQVTGGSDTISMQRSTVRGM